MDNPIIKNKIQRLYKKDKRERVFRNLSEIRTVLIFFNTNDFDLVSAFIKQLIFEGKSPEAYAYKEKKDSADYLKTAYTIITEKDVSNWFDNKLKDTIKKLTNNRYDVLFDLTIGRNYIMEYLVLMANADLKIGNNKGLPSPYDMAINLPELEEPPQDELPDPQVQVWELEKEISRVDELIEHIMHYLRMINAE
jgi:hypothetical protein